MTKQGLRGLSWPQRELINQTTSEIGDEDYKYRGYRAFSHKLTYKRMSFGNPWRRPLLAIRDNEGLRLHFSDPEAHLSHRL